MSVVPKENEMKLPREVASASKIVQRIGDQGPAITQVVDPLAVADWDAQISTLPGASFFHTAGWARTIEQTYSYRPIYLVRTESGKISGLLPIMEVDSWLTGRRGIALPFSDECPAIGAGIHEMVEEMNRMGRDKKWKYWEIRGSEKPQDRAVPSISFLEHSIPLTGGEQEIFDRFEPSVRRAIRKAEKAGLSIEQTTSLEGVRTFYELHCQTRQKHGVPPQPFEFFVSFQRHVLAHNRGFVVIARHQGTPVAASVFVHFGTEAIYKYGASDENFQNFRGANLVMWHGIQWFARAGFHRVSLGRTSKGNEGLRRFKLGWGADERALDYFRYDLSGNRYITGQDDAPGWSNRVVSLIPIMIAKAVGRCLYRHIA